MFVTAASYNDAYQSIVTQHRAASASSILIAAAPDVDALCAAKMLAMLLREDNITHRITPVAGLAALADLKEELSQNEQVRRFFTLTRHAVIANPKLDAFVYVFLTRLQLHTLVLINFGAHLDLPSDAWFGLFPETLHVHVIDSSRPYNLSSLFGAGPAERIVVWDDGEGSKLDAERAAWFALEVCAVI
jgi:cell division control protein 45